MDTRVAAVTGDLTCAQSPVRAVEPVGLVASPKRGGVMVFSEDLLSAAEAGSRRWLLACCFKAVGKGCHLVYRILNCVRRDILMCFLGG